MPNTRGFEVVAEVGIEVLREFLRSAWENGGTADKGAIPNEIAIQSGITFPGTSWTVDYGQVQIPQAGLSLNMAPAENGVTVGLAVAMQVAMDPNTVPLPSLSLFDMTADISITAPFGIISDTENNIGIIFEGLPRNNVSVSITSGDPIGPITLDLISEYVHARYEDETIPHTQTMEGVSIGFYTADVFVELFDDPSDFNYQINVSEIPGNQIKLSIPIHLRLNNMEVSVLPQELQPLSPMGVLARIAITAPLISTSGSMTAQLSAANVAVEKFDGTPCIGGDYCTAAEVCLSPAPDVEGTNYNLNKSAACALPSPLGPIDLETLLITNIVSEGHKIVSAIGDITVNVPNQADIEEFIGDQVHAEVVSRRYIGAWTPETPEGSPVEVNEVRPKALSDALAIAINPQAGANENLLDNFIPAGQDFGIAVDADLVEEIIGETVDKPESEGGLGGVPKTFDDIEGYRARLNELNWDLRSGAIHFWGEVKVYDVFCGADATASFWADIGLRWKDPDAEGRQELEPYLIDKDVDLPWWVWLIAVIGFLVGIIIGIIILVIELVIEDIAEKVGGAVMEDEVSGKLQVLGAWPQQLQGIGTVATRFRSEVGIDSNGLLFSGSMQVFATYRMALKSAADTGGPYTGLAGAPIHFYGGPDHPRIIYHWNFGDGNSADGNEVNHIYADDGLYVLRLTTIVDEPGGATTHHSSWVRMQNVAPLVNAGSDKLIDEGETVNFVGSFSDQEWPDTHEATWDFGDDSIPVAGNVTETNAPPQASGSVQAEHAFGDDGVYRAILTVRDDDGGVGRDRVQITVRNVPPSVEAGPDLYAYPNFPIRLIADFTDPGWLDSHKGTWDFGDCSAQRFAVIEERNEPPQGVGQASATHVYRCCGDYRAVATVIDDDNGVGNDDLLVRVVELNNSNFEGGFRKMQQGVVANGWLPYSLAVKDVAGNPTASAAPSPFNSEEFILNDGQRSQKISHSDPFRAGIYQSIGANPGWQYEIFMFYHLAEPGNGTARLGLDPTGGVDPEAADVVWVSGGQHAAWANLSVRAEAVGERITIFLEILQTEEKTSATGYFDQVALIPYQPICPKLPCEPTCVDFTDFAAGTAISESFTHQQIKFTPLGDQVRMIALGEPPGQIKLVFPREGVRMDFPQAVDEVEITVNNYAGRTLYFTVYAGDTLVKNFSEIVHNEAKQLRITHSGLTALEVSGGDNEAGIVEVCLCLPEVEQEPCVDTCVDFEAFSEQKPLMHSFTYQNITFIPLGDHGFRIVTWGRPEGRKKLVFPGQGVRIELPQAVDEVELLVNNYYGTSLDFSVFAGDSIVQQFTEQIENEDKMVMITQPVITAIEIKKGGNEAALVEICLCLPV